MLFVESTAPSLHLIGRSVRNDPFGGLADQNFSNLSDRPDERIGKHNGHAPSTGRWIEPGITSGKSVGQQPMQKVVGLCFGVKCGDLGVSHCHSEGIMAYLLAG